MLSPINITSEEWHMIEAYLDQKVVSKETPLINEELTQIPNVIQKIVEVKRVREEIEDSILQSKIRGFHKQVEIDEEDSGIRILSSKKTKSKFIWFSMVAVVLVLFGIFWMLDNTTPAEKIFAKNFQPDIGLPLKMNTVNTYEFYEGMLDYKQGNYKDAIAKWQVLLIANPENDSLNYFLGVSNMALGNSKKSLEYLQNQERFQQGIFKEDAAFYAALAKIKEGEFAEAKVFLKNNPSPRNTNLLKELDEQ